MKKFLIFAVAAAVLTACAGSSPSSLPRKNMQPEAQQAIALAADSVFCAVNSVTACELHSFMLLQHDSVIYERYAPDHTADRLHILWSATKTFTAVAVGFAVQDGLLDINRPVADYLPEAKGRLNEATTRDCLRMCSGIKAVDITDRIRGGQLANTLDTIQAAPIASEHGTSWYYNNIDTYLCGRVVTAVTGKSLEDYLNEKLFSRIGIDRWVYETDAMGYNTGSWGMHLSPESLMRFGLFMLHRGQWQGEQLLNAEWIDEMTSVQALRSGAVMPGETDDDWFCGYGYQLWNCHIPGTYRADGMWGQLIIVMPEKDAICVMTSMNTNVRKQMNAFWSNVYPLL